MKHVCASLFVLLAAGCAPSYKITVSSASTVAKPPTCEFRVVNLPPGPGFEEIATLTPDPDKSWDSDPEAFKERVRADVCRVGGDLVVTEINAKGFFARGTVLRKVAEAPVTPAAPSS